MVFNQPYSGSRLGREQAQITGRNGYQSNLVVLPTPLLVHRPGQIVTKKVYLDRKQPRL